MTEGTTMDESPTAERVGYLLAEADAARDTIAEALRVARGETGDDADHPAAEMLAAVVRGYDAFANRVGSDTMTEGTTVANDYTPPTAYRPDDVRTAVLAVLYELVAPGGDAERLASDLLYGACERACSRTDLSDSSRGAVEVIRDAIDR
jgi:hypothetical protein